jgi:NAD(P)-dependent dehydrogenase (short-subunit alcohol dehydrogenase family)
VTDSTAPAVAVPPADLTGKVAIVTGASQGIGRAYTLALAGAGARVVACARTLGGLSDQSPERTLAGLVATAKGTTLPGEVLAVPCDLGSEADIVSMVNQAAANFQGIDVVINNAGLYPHHDSLAVTADELDREWSINVRAPYLLIREAVPHMILRGGGSIINITSRVARFTDRDADRASHEGLFVYGVTKAALDRLTSYLAEELRSYDIAVNGLSPGCVLTDTWRDVAPADYEDARLSGVGKAPLPEVMGPAMLYLAAQTAKTMTGQILHTDTFGRTWP